MNSSTWPIDDILIGTKTLGQNGLKSNPDFKTGASPSDAVSCHTQDTKRFQVLLSNTNNSIQHRSSVCTQLNDFKYTKSLDIFIWLIDEILTGTSTRGQSGPGSNGNKEALHIPQSPRNGASSSD